MSNLKILGKDTAIYGFASVLKKIIGFVLLPFYTRALSPNEYGVFDTIATFTFFIGIIIALGLDGATGRYFFIAYNEKEKSKVLYTSIVIRIISNVLPVILLIPFSGRISTLLFGNTVYKWVLVIALISIPVQNISQLQEILFRYYRVPWKYVIVSIVRAIVNPSLGILLVIILQWGVFGATLASLISSTIVLIFAYLYYTRKKYVAVFSWYWAKKMLRFGYPLIFTGILLWVNNVSDRFFLLHYSTLDQIGLYSIGNTFSQPILLINMALTMSSTILVMSLYNEEQNNTNKPRTKAFLTKIWYTYLAISGSIAVMISVFSYEIVKIVTTPEYIGGILALPFLLFSQILYQSAQLTGVGMTLEEKSKPYIWIMLAAAGTNVLLNFYFIPKYGFVGAAITTILSNIVYFIYAYFWSQRVFYIKRSFSKPMFYFITALGISVFIPYAQFKYDMSISFWQKIAFLLSACVLPIVFKLISIDSIKAMVVTLKNRIK
jgi:O-antigen/teichoic acid export membrane protein